jgi:hypothetical protein
MYGKTRILAEEYRSKYNKEARGTTRLGAICRYTFTFYACAGANTLYNYNLED